MVPQEEVVPTVADTDRQGMYLSIVSAPQHPVDPVPRKKLANKALVQQRDIMSEIKPLVRKQSTRGHNRLHIRFNSQSCATQGASCSQYFRSRASTETWR